MIHDAWEPNITATADHEIELSVGIPQVDFSRIVTSDWMEHGRLGGFNRVDGIDSLTLFRGEEARCYSQGLDICGIRACRFHIRGALDLAFEVRRRRPSLRAAHAKISDGIAKLIAIFHDRRDDIEYGRTTDTHGLLMGLIGVYAITVSAWDGGTISVADISTGRYDVLVDRVERLDVGRQMELIKLLIDRLASDGAIPPYVVDNITPWLVPQTTTTGTELEW